jgi:pimeloyl-ACP methyl ester carboxylesterase
LQSQARKDHNVLDRLFRIPCPTFVVNGGFDAIAPPANAQAIVERVADGSLHVYEDGHASFLQDPVAWTELVTLYGVQDCYGVSKPAGHLA